MAYSRRRSSNPASRARSAVFDVARVVEYGAATTTTWATSRVLPPGNAIAVAGSVASLAQQFPGDAESADLASALGIYMQVALRIAHDRGAAATALGAFNSLAAILAGSAANQDAYDAAWTSIGRSLLAGIRTWPEHLALGYWRQVRSIVDQMTIAQMPGYQFGNVADLRSPPPAGPLIPGGQPPGSQPPGSGGAETRPPSVVDRVARELANWGPELGAVMGSEFGPMGSIAGAYLGNLIRERYGDSYQGRDALDEATRTGLAAEAWRRAKAARRGAPVDPGYQPPRQEQPNLPGFPVLPEPGQTAPGNSPARPTVDTDYSGQSIGAGVGGLLTAVVGGLGGQQAGAAVAPLFTGLGGLAGNAIDENT